MSSRDSLAFFEGLSFSDAQAVIAVPIVKEIKTRLRFLVDVGRLPHARTCYGYAFGW